MAIILGRAIIRAEALQAQVDQLRARLAEYENGVEAEKVTNDA